MVLVRVESTGEMGNGVVDDRSRPAVQRWSGIIGTGQSLSIGTQATLTSATEPAPYAYRLEDSSNNYSIDNPDAESLSLTPFTEPFRTIKASNNSYPANIDGKTPQHSMTLQVNLLSRLAGTTPPTTVHTTVGRGGAPMFVITKDGTGNSYDASLFEARALRRLASEEPHSARLEYDAIVLTHGETDAMFGHTTYADEVIKLRDAYAKDLAAITGQTKPPILILSQQSSVPYLPKAEPPRLIQDQWWVQRQSDNAVVCAGPKYQIGYAPGGLHLDIPGYNRLGEKYGQVYFETVVRGNIWEPLRPRRLELTRPGVITAAFHVPVGHLCWDEALMECAGPLHQSGPHTYWAKGRGFEVRDGLEEPLPIESVEITGKDEVDIKLATKDYRKPLRLAYAMTVDVERCSGGNGDGRMGFLCDCDDTPSASAEVLTCELRNGSREISCRDGWRNRSLCDLVTVTPSKGDDGTAAENCLVAFDKDDPTKATLHKAWQGPDGDAYAAKVQHSLRNYCVSFSMITISALGQGL